MLETGIVLEARKGEAAGRGGANDGRVQNFVTPGLMLSKLKLEHHPGNRLALVIGGGMQIATTQFHTYNHGLVLTTRMLF